MALPTFQLVPTATNATAPFCLGHAFKPGDVPAGSSVTAPFSDFQCISKNAWPDGSLKFAILSGRASVTGTTPLFSQLSVGAAATGTAIAASSISAVATVDCGTFGAVTWSGTDWATPFQTWISGPKMSSFVYRKPVGTDAHLVAWLEVRVWSGGELEVLPWIENGYILVTAPANKNATYTFTLGGTQRCSVAVDLKSHQRTPIINGSAISYWLGAAPGISIKHDTTYLQATELVPTYSASVTTAAGDTPVLPTTYTPLQQGGFNYDGDSMGGTGAQDPIGLLPLHDVLYLTSSADLYPTVIRNGFSAGRYCLHWRDETTNRPLKFSSYPTLNIDNGQGFGGTGGSTTGSYTPAVTGGAGPSWDVAHCPSTGYMAYLASGLYYFMEEVQFQATTNYLGNGDNDSLREGSKGITKPCVDAWQTRSCAWQTRSLFQALSATPDGHPLQVEFANSVKSNIDHFYNRYVAQPNNPFGFIQAGVSSYGGKTSIVPPWQEDFVSGAFGMGLAMNLPIPSAYQTKLAAFFQWHAQSVVGRMTAADGDFPYMNADMYVISLSTVQDPDWVTGTGPWRASWAEVYAVRNATLAVSSSPTGWITTDPTMLAGEIFPGAKALWGNLQPAIAYAVRHNAPGASAAYARMKSAANWPTLQTALNTSALWSVVPSGQTTSGGTLTTPGPSFIWDSAPLIANSFIWDTYRGLGIPLSAVPTGGTNGTSVIRALIESGDNANSEARVRYISTPSGFASGGDTSYTSPAGAINYEAYLDGASLGQATDTVGTGGGGDTTAPTMNGAIVSSNITPSSFTLTWPAASDNVAVTGYEVSIDAGSNYVDVGNVLTANKSALAASTSYQTRVRAYDAAGNRATPLSATVNTGASSDSTAPNMQGSLSVSLLTESGFTVGWIAASDNVAVVGYEFSTDNGSTYSNIGSVLSYAKTGLSPLTLYNVKVRAYDGAGNRSTPLSTTATTLAAGTVPGNAVCNYLRKVLKASKFKITRFR